MNALQSLFSALTFSTPPAPVATAKLDPPHLPETHSLLQPYIASAQGIKGPGQVIVCNVEQDILVTPRLFFTWVPKSAANQDLISALRLCYRTFFDYVAQALPTKKTVLSVHPLLEVSLVIQLPVILQECERFLETHENFDRYEIYIAKGGIEADRWLWTTEKDKIIPRSRVHIHYQEWLAHHQNANFALLDIEAKNGLAALLHDFEERLVASQLPKQNALEAPQPQTPQLPKQKFLDALLALAAYIVSTERYSAEFTFSDDQKNEMKTLIQQGHLQRGDVKGILDYLERNYEPAKYGLQSLFALSAFLYRETPTGP